jgi:hypothetical protein
MTYIAIAVFALVVFMLSGCGIIALCQAADDKPKEMPMNQLMRIIQTKPGDGLAVGIRRAFIVSIEHGPTCLIHLGIPVVVTADGTPYEHEARWRETAKLYQRREVCNGK